MFPWKDFLMGRIRKIQKTKGGKGHTVQEKKKKKQEEKKKKRFFTYVEVPILMFSPSVGNILVRPSLRRTLSYGDLPHQPSALPENEANREGSIMKKNPAAPG
jgi:hypothetical protein